MNQEGFRLFDGADPTKKAKFVLSEITSGKVVALIIPNKDGKLVLEGDTSFLNLKDTPNSYIGASSKFIRVKEDGTGIEFASVESGGGSAFTSRISVRRAEALNLPRLTYVKIPFDTELWDNDNEHTEGRFTATAAGYYHVTACAGSQAIADTKTAILSIYKNGSVYSQVSWNAGMSVNPRLCCSVDVYLNGSTDYIEVYWYHNSTADVALRVDGVYDNSLCIHRFA